MEENLIPSTQQENSLKQLLKSSIGPFFAELVWLLLDLLIRMVWYFLNHS
jgi:hypothetical protein